MELKLTNTDLQAAISEAILTQIGVEAREQMLREAIKHVVEKRSSQYGQRDKASIVEDAFGDACAKLTREIIERIVREDPQVTEQLTKVARDAIAHLLSEGERRDLLVHKFAEVFTGVLAGEYVKEKYR
jgi:hypothetical protein